MKPCHCNAYPFPHRALGGKCTHQTIFDHYSMFADNKAAAYLTDRFCWAPCVHLHEWDEIHPYGSTTAREHLCECRVEEIADCPIVEHIIHLSHRKEVA